MTATPAYYWRHHTPYVAWFCSAGAARAWLEAGEEIYCVHDGSYLAAVGHEPQEGVQYEDLGHAHCIAENCPEGA